MSERFIFHGQTTFIDKPRDTVIQNFQNQYITGDGSQKDQINSEIKKLVDLILRSKDLPKDDQEETVKALHEVAEKVKDEKGSKLTFKGTLTAVQDIVSKAADIAVPALGIITVVMKLMGLG
jgi:hypothetical protein